MARLDSHGCFFDTSVLLGGILDFGEKSAASQALMTAVAKGKFREPATAWHCCMEFYAVVTRMPAELRLSPREAALLVEEELFGRFQIRDLEPDARTQLMETAAAEAVTGGRLYDLHIGEIAWRSGARLLVTDNARHFGGVARRGVQVLSSGELAKQAGL